MKRNCNYCRAERYNGGGCDLGYKTKTKTSPRNRRANMLQPNKKHHKPKPKRK